ASTPAEVPRSGGTIPTVGLLETDLFRDGDEVRLDGTLGTVELEGVRAVEVVTAFLERDDGRILLLRRSEQVGSFRGFWAGVSGFLEDPTPEAQAIREIREETGIVADELRLEGRGGPIYARDGGSMFVVHGFRFATRATQIRLDWEHSQSEWVDPSEIGRRPSVPKLAQVWNAVRPGASPSG
ncbi:MAG: NUDIX domain-containing protein, partial [Thermoplasmata archaeon]|nr:NUDIX domain-containing protein [Thermoplasmata archaeon]